LVVILVSLIDLFHAYDVVQVHTKGISELQGVIMTVRIRITVHGKEWNSSAHEYFYSSDG